jgi:acetoin utilization protein AcuB
MQVSQRMTKNPVTVGPDETLAVAAEKLKAGNFRRLPVIEDGNLIGVLSEFDVRAHGESLHSVAVRAVMTDTPVVIAPTATLERAAATLANHRIGALPVVSGGKLIGIITAKDLLLPEPRPLPEWMPPGSTVGGINYTADFVIELESQRGSDGAWTAECRNIPGVKSAAPTENEALRGTASAALRSIADLVAKGDPHWAHFIKMRG